MDPRHPFLDTCEQILREELPNLLRLYINPHVTQACFCLERYVKDTWQDGDDFQTFLANGFDEALSGAIKLARYCASVAGRSSTGLIVDAAGRLGPFVGVTLGDGAHIEFVPGLTVLGREDADPRKLADARFGFVVLIADPDGGIERHAETVREIVRRDAPLRITCIDRPALTALRQSKASLLRELTPDVVVFDESFVNRDVPFSAFTTRRSHYDHWNRPGKTTFHSTTYQPNTISSLHFLRCLERDDPEFHRSIAVELAKIRDDPTVRRALFRRLYSPSLLKTTRSAGFDVPGIRASGSYVHVGGRAIFDGVSGVARSVRGHNPPKYVAELEELAGHADAAAEVAARLRELTGLEGALPAVSGATAVENALKLGLVAQHPRRHVLALKAGFGGKTLFALTGTANSAYKERIEPLYADVLYVDPFAPDATAQIDAALAKHPVAVAQMELIQAVGGVRPVPETVVRHLEARRQQHGFLLLIDEVQTGLHRTGPFTLSRSMGLTPDLLVFGKGASDMMFPFGMVLYSAEVGQRLERAGSDLPAALRARYGYEFGYRTLLNVLRRSAELHLEERVTESGARFAQLLNEGLRGCKAVREVRAHGLLIGIELETRGWPRHWLRKQLYLFYILNLLRHARFPVLVGFCQYEPNVLKFTPALTTTTAEVRAASATIIDVLRRPWYRLLPAALGGLMRSKWTFGGNHHDHGRRAVGAAHEPVSR